MSKRASSSRRVAAFVAALWGEDVIAVHRAARGRLSVGEHPGASPIAPAVRCEPFELVRVEREALVVSVPCGADARRARMGGANPAEGDDVDEQVLVGPTTLTLARGEEVLVRAGALSLLVAAVEPAAQAPRATRERGAGAHVLVAAVLHALILGVSWHGAAAAEALADDQTPEQMRGWIASAERRAAARERIVVDPEVGDGGGKPINDLAGDGRPGGGAKAAGAEGRLGDELSRSNQNRRFALPKAEEPARRLGREEVEADAATFGMVGLLAAARATPVAAFGDPWAAGADAIAARGGMWSHAIGEAPGSGGLGLHGIGDGGGGTGEGVGLGGIGVGHTLGAPGDGTGGWGSPKGGFGQGFSSWSDRIGRSGHVTKAPVLRCGCGISVSGRLPPESIQRVVRQNFGRFRACYERGLKKQPALEGRVATKFLIDARGLVASAQNAGSDLPDSDVVSCVVAAFRTLQFPEVPSDDLVGVTYPIVFSPE